ncbi:hypothetical protein OGM63_27145 [Plectonema radiosum NIES-515]|uniref:Rho termination factor N-terminal domain-containing protein n=1 Tax=Plectonema radiosum NIES-515 TaxID=2986073 RepID=A0ABT3B6Y2_9CYAN|nr:hypothetical protein [Plectonema radiosum]MCV3217142.1 hypothetical protein [Plectonema radiosum NIES-515]
MDAAERHDRIVEYLRIKPISHGQIYTFQIAIPKSEDLEISSERRENLERSLTQQGSNLIPLIVRRTEAYSEEEEYEVVYGADLCHVAKELDIEKLWVWVFDMTDEQAVAAKEEMQQLLGSSDSSPVVVQPPSEQTESNKPILQKLDKLSQQVEIINKKVETLTSQVEQVAASVKKLEANQSKQTSNDDKLTSLTDKVEQIADAIKKLEESKSNQTTIDDKLVQQISEVVKEIVEDFLKKQQEIEPVINKKTTTDKTKTTGYKAKTKDQLKDIAKERGIKITSSMTKDSIIKTLELAEKSN